MANDFSSTVYYIDTTFTTGDPVTRNHRVRSIVWNDAASQGDQLVIKDAAGKYVVNATCQTPNQAQVFSFVDTWIMGLQVPTLGSGNVQVFIR